MNFDFHPSLWFVCKLCGQAFPDIDKLNLHKLQSHLTDCLNIKCIVFEEKLLDHEWIPPDKFRSLLNPISNSGGSKFYTNLNPDPTQNVNHSQTVTPLTEAETEDVDANQNLQFNPPAKRCKVENADIEFDVIETVELDSNSDFKSESNVQMEERKFLLQDLEQPTNNEVLLLSSVNLQRNSLNKTKNQSQSKNEDLFATQNQNRYFQRELIQKSIHQEPSSVHVNLVCSSPIPKIETIVFEEQIPNRKPIPSELSSVNLNLNRNIFEDEIEVDQVGISAISSGNKPFMCPVCFIFYPTNYSLKYHMKSHSEDRPIVCQHCSLTFKYKSSLERHLIVSHGKATAYKCHLCGRSFYRTKELQDHERVAHTGHRPFKCPIEHCKSAFLSKNALSMHTKVKHCEELGLQQFVCPTCGRTYGLKSLLNKHITSKH